jgi:ABC-type oligopeptide transport system substrate-binding subunit
MKWQIIPDASTRTNAVQSKSVQAIDSVPYLSIDQLKTTSQVDSVQGFGLLFAMFNNSAGNPFATKENRQAFFYAIDMAKVVQTAMLGQASPATSFVQEGHPQYVKAKTVYSHDAAKATAMFGDRPDQVASAVHRPRLGEEVTPPSRSRSRPPGSRWSSPRRSPPTSTHHRRQARSLRRRHRSR